MPFFVHLSSVCCSVSLAVFSKTCGKKNAKSKQFAVGFSSLGGQFSVILDAPGAHFLVILEAPGSHFGGLGANFEGIPDFL